MTTARQIRQLFAPLLTENPDIVLHKNYIYLKPVSHVHRCIGIGRSGGRDAFIVTAAVNFTFNLSGVIWEWPLGIRGYGWCWSDPDMPDLFKRLVGQALTQLRTIATLEDFAPFASRDMTFITSPLYAHKDCQLRVDIALGNLDKALADCRELDRLRGPAPHTEYFARLWSRVVDPALPLLERRDVAGLTRLLREWQATYIEVTGLGGSFDPTPFPLELAAGA
ncbi:MULTISPECIES: hypothetical protein [unclassified Bosea (in: a-proteobacteria)]|uniref:hypothetical protein n=1 Tax=unclassified Bosea (in: a-proteobacteria) TaxID=2653178 RepID=UPI000F757C8D|nr:MULTISPECIES: hypothetical protein [unclassified Bosea (in: a-proteobacteria)]AZO80262.1 hypothetical protein BLM15_23805 [Bosea sp. Tri-49]RXT23058.1 hypothetical protein B5U98_10595 [Bosea sp. Tri-39]RXT38529.1 hypothetical protein B5U99_10045 [Bosea sp. Tri-54]